MALIAKIAATGLFIIAAMTLERFKVGMPSKSPKVANRELPSRICRNRRMDWRNSP